MTWIDDGPVVGIENSSDGRSQLAIKIAQNICVFVLKMVGNSNVCKVSCVVTMTGECSSTTKYKIPTLKRNRSDKLIESYGRRLHKSNAGIIFRIM